MSGECDLCVCVCVFDLRVHSFSGVLELMWTLSIQICPLVPCAKKPSITTYQKPGEEEEEEGEEGGERRGGTFRLGRWWQDKGSRGVEQNGEQGRVPAEGGGERKQKVITVGF